MKKQFERQSADPLYIQVINSVKRDISNGTYSIGSRLPSEQELCTRYEVSRITVRKAMEVMTGDGTVIRKQGKGTFVAQPKKRNDLRPVISFHESVTSLGKVPGAKVISAKTLPASPMDIHNLRLPERSRIVETRRVRMADDVPVMLEINHFSMVYSYLLESDLSGSLYALIGQYGIEPENASREISLVNADFTIAKALEIDEGTPLLLLNEIIYDQKGRPLHTSRQYIRGDIFTMRL